METLPTLQASNLPAIRVEVSDRPLPLRMRLPSLHLRGMRPRHRTRLPILSGTVGFVPLTAAVLLAVRASRMPR
jgi:hypothetical protein